MSYAPTTSHRNPDEPQMEVCQLCGLHVGGAHLREAVGRGIEGLMVCDVTEGCKRMRSIPDRRGTAPHAGIGQSPVYPHGAPDWAE